MARSTLIVTTLCAARAAHAEPLTPPPLPEPHWLVYAAFRNDAFTEVIPPIDDQGFTHDNVFLLRRQLGDDAIGGGFAHRWITSRSDRRRWDQLELFATGERGWPAPLAIDLPHRTSVALRLGPVLGGNFGGLYMQNGWHTLTKSGPTVEQGLQNNYDGTTSYGFVTGARARAELGETVRGYGFLDGQLALGGTGVSSAQAALGGALNGRYLGMHVELGVTRYHVGDPNLALPGAYRTGFQLEWRAGVNVHWSRFRIGYEYRANESGSGEPMGVLEFQSRR